MGIPIGNQYEYAHSASIRKEVVCEHCECRYGYEMTRSARSTGNSILWLDNEGARERARTRAIRRVERSLEQSCDLVPCPDCGWYQRDMVGKIRLRRIVILTALALIPAIAVGVWGSQVAETHPYWEYNAVRLRFVAYAIATFFAVPVVGYLIWRLRDVNANHEQRSERITGRRGRAIRLGFGETRRSL
jgi:hypothetical protein